MSTANPNEPATPAGDVLQIPKDPPAPNGQQTNTDPVIPPQADAPRQTARVLTTEDIEKARKEEKDKLYPRLSTLEEELKALRKEREERTAAEEKARKDAEAAAAARAAEEMSAKELLAQKEQEWNQRFAAIEQDRQRQQALLDAERRFAALADYRQRRVGEEADNILPELRDLVTGNSEEEIEQSLTGLRERTERILGNVTGAMQAQRQQQRGVPVTNPPVGPMDNDPAYESVSADDIRNMDMATYAKNRDRLLGAATNKVSNRGLYG